MRLQRVAAWGSAAAVIAAVLAGLSMLGSPAEQRSLRLDERRVTDLRMLAGAVERYWGERRELPARAEDVVDGRTTTRLPLDPESKQVYEYRATGPGHYELCATFSRPSLTEEANDFWSHAAGRRCFSFAAGQNVYPR
jgi:hypothetical protein